MFGDGLMHWHGVSRALATHWYHVSIQRLHEGQFRNYEEMLNDETRLVELLLAQDESLVVREVQAVTPAWMNKGDGWKMQKLRSLSVGFSVDEVPVSILEVEGGEVYIDTHERVLDWRDRRKWLMAVPKYASQVLTSDVRKLIEDQRPKCWSDDLTWLPNHEELLPAFSEKLWSYYTHAKAFHGCRPENLATYFDHGLQGQDPERIKAHYQPARIVDRHTTYGRYENRQLICELCKPV